MLGTGTAKKIGTAAKSTGKWFWTHKGPVIYMALGAVLTLALAGVGADVMGQPLTRKN